MRVFSPGVARFVRTPVMHLTFLSCCIQVAIGHYQQCAGCHAALSNHNVLLGMVI